MMYRHGDLLLKQVEKCEGNEIAKDLFVLAEGETTGHKHVLSGEGVRFFENNGMIMVQIPTTAQLTHEEHAQINLLAGSYQVVRQRELDLAQHIRQVAD